MIDYDLKKKKSTGKIPFPITKMDFNVIDKNKKKTAPGLIAMQMKKQRLHNINSKILVHFVRGQ